MKTSVLFLALIFIVFSPLNIFSKNIALNKPVKASSFDKNYPPENAVDGDKATWWSAGGNGTGWIEIDLQEAVNIERITLITKQLETGESDHLLWGRTERGQYQLLFEFKGKTTDKQALIFIATQTISDIRYIKIETTLAPGQVSWRELDVEGLAFNDEFIQVAGNSWNFEVKTTQRPFLPFGVNYYDPNTYHDLPYPAFDVIGSFDTVDVDRQLGKIRSLGADVVRVFLSVISFEPTLFTLNETSFRKLDRLIGLVRKNHLRIILDTINDWEGSSSWESWDNFGDETTIQGYEYYLNALALRYKDNPTIMAWSLKNEPVVRGPGSGIMANLWLPYVQLKYGTEANLYSAWSDYPRSGESWNTIQQPTESEYDALNSPGDQRFFDYQLFREDIAYNWVRRLSAALRSGDSNHLITIGLIQYSVPIFNASSPLAYPAFNPKKIARFLDYSSIHSYNWWDTATASTYVEACCRYSFANKPVVVEEYDLTQTHKTISPLMDSASGWLHWAAFETAGFSTNGLFDISENVTSLGFSFQHIADTIYDVTPVRVPDIASIRIDMKEALTSIIYQNNKFPEYVTMFNSTGGPVGFNLINYSAPIRMSLVDLPEQIEVGQQYSIKWKVIDWPIVHPTSYSIQLSRDGGKQWETLASKVKGSSYIWTVNGPEAKKCLFRITDDADPDIFSVNNKTFSIIKANTKINELSAINKTFQLYPAYPNPFNPSTVIRYQLVTNSKILLTVYNIDGKIIRTLKKEEQPAGFYYANWNGLTDFNRLASSGVYIIRLWINGLVLTEKIILLR